jgi:MFS family permease
VLTAVLKLFHSKTAVPAELNAVFRHLFWDIAWFGITAGSSLAFLSVYAARLGADTLQLGLLSAGPAMVGLFFTLPVGHWLQHRPIGRAVFWGAAFSRINLLWWVFLPVLLAEQGQIWAFVLLVLLMTIPGTVLAVGFNALYAAAVPPEWRGYVAGTRNAILALIFVVTSLLCGYILNHTSLTFGYQIIFIFGFIGAMMSTLQLWYLRKVTTETIHEPEKIRTSIGDFARPGDLRMTGLNLRTNIGLRAFTRGTNLLRLEVLRGSYGKVVAALFVFHFAQFLPIPLFPLYWVDRLHFTDGEIGIGTASFHLAVLLGSLQFARMSVRWGNHKLATAGALVLSTYPLLTAFMPNLAVFIFTSLLGGAAWSMVGGALGNYLLENVPETQRPPYLAWYNLALNAAILLGSLGGSLLGHWMGLSAALVLSFVVRMLSAIAIWRWK